VNRQPKHAPASPRKFASPDASNRRWNPQEGFAAMPVDAPRLSPDEIHVWSMWLDLSSKSTDYLEEYLSPDERQRAARFRFDTDRKRFAVCRGMLREVLSRYLEMSPKRLSFQYGPFGKPMLRHDSTAGCIEFNVSHSGALVLVALSADRPVGIDVERIRTEVRSQEIAERFFSPSEAAKLRSLPASLRAYAFFNCWTRKEAYLKAVGDGLQVRLDSFDVSLAPDESAEFLNGVDPIWALT
jgi:4'-phosphopantetheinyl transferase